ncbi:MAG TPA: hypothetical protein VFV75_12010 [Candidatus Polarisedimenticolaceae bacterium]|nr:hypothetical protein [Candidatus Polarisedimenticolaceae bacterium]
MPGAVDRADIVVKSVRLTDNGDHDGFADPNETVNLYVTLRNSSGTDRDGIVVTVASTDPAVDCISSPVVAFGPLLADEERESTVAAVFHVADVARSDPFAELSATFDFQISGNDFGGTVRPQQVTVDVDLDVSGGLLPGTYTEGFEGAGFGSFTSMTLDTNIASLDLSDKLRCQYSDPDFINSNSYGNTFCYLGFTTAANNAFDWHVHGLGSPDFGRAYLGNNALHWGVHPGAASADTTRLKQLDAVRSNLPINLGWNGVTSVLSFKHQVALTNSDYTSGWDQAVDRGVVQVQLADSSGTGLGNWRKIDPYENVYDMEGQDQFSNCTFDPTDDGNTEDDFFDPTDPDRRYGPSSTCGPEFVFSHLGATFWSTPFSATDIQHASDGPGLQGVRGPGTWVQSKFDLARYRGRRLRLRFLVTTIEVATTVTMQQVFGWNPYEADDGWYIDDLQVTNTLASAATVSTDTADRSALPACGPVCGSLTASVTATPSTTVEPDQEVTLDASGSMADQCPGGMLHYRFWRDWNQNGLLGPGDTVLREWGPGSSATDVPNGTMGYGVDVRCSTRPACAGKATVVVPLVCQSIDPAPFPTPITWAADYEVVWTYTTHRVDAIRGDLDALRASGGQFNATVQLCLLNDTYEDSFTDAVVPDPGEGFYYLVRQVDSAPVCGFDSWRTGSPAEVPGAGGDRDADIALDPDTCP